MFNPLKGLGDLNQLRKQAQQMQQALAQEEVVVEKDGVRIVMSGDQKVKELTIDGQPEIRVAEVLEEALKKTQQIAARQLMSMRGE
ncbi:YbaB/EbfC family nucleoid-associated protein [Candidatus Roizmanbacteria bacterium]|nr:YbaB/EbfC family nucleoid-associated protein [Candidatus Roizmanbacteria bacterium]